MITVMMFLVYYCLMSPLSYYFTSVLPPATSFFLLVVSLVLIVAAGYVINDYFDIEIDKHNKPEKLLISKVFSEKEALISYGILTFLGLAFGLASSVIVLKVKFYILFAVLVLLACLLYSYSFAYKKRLFVGNLIVAFSVAFAVFLPYLFEILYLSDNLLILSLCKDIVVNIVYFVLIYTLFAFLLTLIREIIKDVEDYEGDTKIHCRTIPIVYGVSKTKTMLYVLIILSMLLLFAYCFILFKLQLNMALGLVGIVSLCLFLLMYKLFKAQNKKDFHRLSVMTKMMMLIGLLSMLFLK